MLKIFVRLMLILFLVWLIGFGVFIFSTENINTRTDHNIKYSVVLTGGQNRIAESLILLDKGLTDIVFISGVNPEVTKQDVLSRYYNKYKDRVVLGYKAINTKGNIKEIKEWVEKNNIREIRLITSDYHLYRTLLEFKKFLPNLKIEIFSVKSVDYVFLSSVYNLKMLFSEYNKLIYVFINYGVI